jgi:hypothetical protein
MARHSVAGGATRSTTTSGIHRRAGGDSATGGFGATAPLPHGHHHVHARGVRDSVESGPALGSAASSDHPAAGVGFLAWREAPDDTLAAMGGHHNDPGRASASVFPAGSATVPAPVPAPVAQPEDGPGAVPSSSSSLQLAGPGPGPGSGWLGEAQAQAQARARGPARGSVVTSGSSSLASLGGEDGVQRVASLPLLLPVAASSSSVRRPSASDVDTQPVAPGGLALAETGTIQPDSETAATPLAVAAPSQPLARSTTRAEAVLAPNGVGVSTGSLSATRSSTDPVGSSLPLLQVAPLHLPAAAPMATTVPPIALGTTQVSLSVDGTDVEAGLSHRSRTASTRSSRESSPVTLPPLRSRRASNEMVPPAASLGASLGTGPGAAGSDEGPPAATLTHVGGDVGSAVSGGAGGFGGVSGPELAQATQANPSGELEPGLGTHSRADVMPQASLARSQGPVEGPLGPSLNHRRRDHHRESDRDPDRSLSRPAGTSTSGSASTHPQAGRTLALAGHSRDLEPVGGVAGGPSAPASLSLGLAGFGARGRPTVGPAPWPLGPTPVPLTSGNGPSTTGTSSGSVPSSLNAGSGALLAVHEVPASSVGAGVGGVVPQALAASTTVPRVPVALAQAAAPQLEPALHAAVRGAKKQLDSAQAQVLTRLLPSMVLIFVDHSVVVQWLLTSHFILSLNSYWFGRVVQVGALTGSTRNLKPFSFAVALRLAVTTTTVTTGMTWCSSET